MAAEYIPYSLTCALRFLLFISLEYFMKASLSSSLGRTYVGPSPSDGLIVGWDDGGGGEEEGGVDEA